jgi:hypothetical protein
MRRNKRLIEGGGKAHNMVVEPAFTGKDGRRIRGDFKYEITACDGGVARSQLIMIDYCITSQSMNKAHARKKKWYTDNGFAASYPGGRLVPFIMSTEGHFHAEAFDMVKAAAVDYVRNVMGCVTRDDVNRVLASFSAGVVEQQYIKHRVVHDIHSTGDYADLAVKEEDGEEVELDGGASGAPVIVSVVPAGPAGDANANADNVAGESTLVLAGNLVEATAAALPEVPPE